LVAIAADGELVGVARYIRLDERPTVAEVAVTRRGQSRDA
jgi:hypothetical protein